MEERMNRKKRGEIEKDKKGEKGRIKLTFRENKGHECF